MDTHPAQSPSPVTDNPEMSIQSNLPGKQSLQPRLLLLIALLIFLGLLSILLLVKSKTTSPQQSNPTANWKTYTNKKFGYIIKYPQEIPIEGDENADYVSFDNQITISVSPNDPANCRGDGCMGGDPRVSPTLIHIAGMTANLYSGSQGGVGGLTPQQYKTTVIARSGTGYYYTFTLYELKIGKDRTNQSPIGIPKQEEDLFLRMLSTFTFSAIKQDAGVWKTYTNTKYGFSFSYAPSMTLNTCAEELICGDLSNPNNRQQIFIDYGSIGGFDLPAEASLSALRRAEITARDHLPGFGSATDEDVSAIDEQISSSLPIKYSFYLQYARNKQKVGPYTAFYFPQPIFTTANFQKIYGVKTIYGLYFGLEDGSKLDVLNKILSTFKFTQ